MTPLEHEVTNLLFERWIEPAIDQAKAAGTWTEDGGMYAFQVIFAPETAPEVRFNENVVGLLRMTPSDPSVSLSPGSVVDMAEAFDRIVGWSIETANTRVGFATIYLFRGEWSLFFNTAHNLDPSAKHLDAAREFLSAAASSIDEGRLRVAVDTLCSATELLNKAFLFTFPCYAEGSTHRAVSTEFYRLSRFHWFDSVYTPSVKKLWSLRSTARYLKGPITFDAGVAQRAWQAADEFANWISETITDINRNCLPSGGGVQSS
jgi:uncharacterized protein (UPF0332 family)